SFEKIVRRLRSPEGLSDIPMSKKFLMGEKKIEIKVKVDTIHKVKGETYRAALVVSSPTKKSDGGHFTQWLQKGTEASRFAYVACSRPQDLLVLAIPEYSEEILNLGFYLDDMKEYISV
ncbi:DNA helicase UvrD, partial [Geobacillus zalihae]